jgi:transcriptional activator of cad operon
MDRAVTAPLLRVGTWCVDPTAGKISRDGETIRVDARVMRLLQYLAERNGQVVSVDELLDRVWSGVVVTPDSVYQAVASLRRTLGDDPRQPTFIANVPRLGYRMVATVGPWVDPATPEDPPSVSAGDLPNVTDPPERSSPNRRRMLLAGVALGVVLLAASALLIDRSADDEAAVNPVATGTSPSSVAVLAFLDLTEEMDQEYFGDAMTEDLIDQLSKNQGLRVAPPRSSFAFKGKQATVGEIAAALGVAYVLDGSLRESGSTLRVTARLIRADGGFIVWSQSYERPLGELPTIRDDIVSHVVEALR